MSRRRLTVILGLLSALGTLSIDLYLPSFAVMLTCGIAALAMLGPVTGSRRRQSSS